MHHVAIIGAGMAGLSCAETLRHAGIRTTLFDKGKGPGGRMASRRLQTEAGTAVFDFGAQYFTVRNDAFAIQVTDWEAKGLVARWPAARDDAYVGVPTMNVVLRDLASHHETHFSSLIKGLKRVKNHWGLIGEGAAETLFDGIVLALPAEQTAPILTLHDFVLAQAALFARSQPCWTGMFAFGDHIAHTSGIMRDCGPIAWAARESAKPGRSGPERWVVQANPTWSAQHLERSAESIAPLLLAALAEQCDGSLPELIGHSMHRWRYALSTGTGVGSLWNPGLRLGACGDWLLGPRVECAWMSGRNLAEQMVAAFAIAAE